MSSKHDEIVRWLDSNMDRLASQVLRQAEDWSADEVAEWIKRPNYEPLVQKQPMAILEKTWEHAIVGRRGRPEGYIDLYVVVEFSRIVAWTERSSGRTGVDLVKSRQEICFEVKPRITSVGETIRQIRRYEALLPNWSYYDLPAKWVVCSPDDMHADIFREQGIVFLSPSGAQLSMSF